MGESTKDPFEVQEEAVLSFLLTRPDIAEAVDLAIEGKHDQAVPKLVKAVQGILNEKGAEGATAQEPPPAVQASTPGQAEKRGAEEAAGQKDSAAKRQRLKPGNGPARCICVIVSGLHGCGKSTCCNLLRETFGGTWLNYDEFSSKRNGKNVRQAFIQEFKSKLVRSLSAADQDKNERLLYVDRNSLTRAHRTELLMELQRLRWRTRGGTILWVEFSHSADTFGYGANGQLSKRYCDQHILLCGSRIEQRGAAHHTLKPSPKLKSLLQNVAKAAEAPSPDELAMFDGRVTVEVTQSPTQIASRIVEELRKLQWFEQMRSPEEMTAKIDVAWQAYQRAESLWRSGAAARAEEEPQQQQEWLTQCRQAVASEKKAARARAEEIARTEETLQRDQADERECHAQDGESVPVYYKIDLPEVSNVLAQRGILPADFVPIESPHATLLYIGSDGDDERAAQKANLSVEQFQAMREALEALQEEEFEVKMTQIVLEESVACAVISLPPIVPCANRVPHVTLGTKPGVPPRYANEILEEVRAGREEGVTAMQLETPRPLKGRLLLHREPVQK